MVASRTRGRLSTYSEVPTAPPKAVRLAVAFPDTSTIGRDYAQPAQRYAELVVRVGANVGRGQHVFLQTTVEHAPFARAVVDAAYGAGARYVDGHYTDQFVRRSFIEAAGDEMLTYSPPWHVQRLESMNELRAAEILIIGDPTPGLFAGADESRLGRAQPRELIKRQMEIRLRDRTVNWTIVAAPSTGWAEEVYGTPPVSRRFGARSSMRFVWTNPIPSRAGKRTLPGCGRAPRR